MKKILELWDWFKDNWLIIFIAVWFSLYSWSQAMKIDEAIDVIATTRSMDISKDSKATYVPGAYCVIKATPDVPKQVFMDHAMACARQHELYLADLEELNAQEVE